MTRCCKRSLKGITPRKESVPVIKVWCLPPDQTEENLRKLHQTIVAAAVSVQELGLKDQNDMTCLFPTDLMKYGLGEEIIIEVTGLPERRSGGSDEPRKHLAQNLIGNVQALYPQARIECTIAPFATTKVLWVSKRSTIETSI